MDPEPRPVGDDRDDQTLDRGLAFAFGSQPWPGALPSVLDQIGARIGATPRISLRDLTPAAREPGAEETGSGTAGATGRDAGRYQVLGLLGRGGVGIVHHARDTDLGRDVAMKFLDARFRERPEVLHRFVEEAQIGGQLQHPGIVPVYELGIASDQPFFTMKLIEGQTLARRLAARPSPDSDRRTFLSIFESVCLTMAYAHARGVVHRDLKPANVMIGSFGEVQVVDWGLGKVLHADGAGAGRTGPTGPAPRGPVETVRSAGHGTPSELGSVMGTPAYMPPEQACGDVEAMDERSDVFGLGAILCEILTGQPPYPGDQDEAIRRARTADLAGARARLAACGAEPELVDLALRCLMPAREQRPASAGLVARAVQDHLAAAEARVHAARVEAAEARVRAAALKRVQALGTGLIAVIAAGLLASLWFWRSATDAATEAAGARDAARQSLDSFNRLSHVVKLEAARERERALHPAWPAQAGALRRWLDDDATSLRQALPDLRATMALLEARALPASEEERLGAASSNARAAELAALRQKLAALQRAQAVRAGAVQPATAAPDERASSRTAAELNELAWHLVAPDRTVFGREAEGLALARRAIALAPPAGEERGMVADTLAWALFANGLDAEAIEWSRAAVAAVAPAERAAYEGKREQLERAVATMAGAVGRAAIAALEEGIAALGAEIALQREWRFADAADQFLHGALRRLVVDVESFVARDVPGVERRLMWAERVEELTVERHRERWEEARRAILAADGIAASELYAEPRLELEPQMGLVPIGVNPQSKLWEFHHLRSAWDPEQQPDPGELAAPQHGEDGALDVNDRGIVFVLVPGGRFAMGAQDEDPDAPNHDPDARPNEAPVREVELEPFFLSKYELTQGQWARLSGGAHPSFYQLGRNYSGIPTRIQDKHPVEQVSWQMCRSLLGRHGLALPTEAQWERACRAGGTTPWHTGRSVASLEGFVNLLDQTAQTVAPRWGPGGVPFDDHCKGPAAVGTYRPNAFGLFDVHGNVWEWCEDRCGSYTAVPRAGDGLRDPRPWDGTHALRGGACESRAADARSAVRARRQPDYANTATGVRPARAVMR